MEVRPVAGVEDLESHIHLLSETPDTPLNAKLFDDVEIQLNETNTPPLTPRLLPPLITLLTITPHDATPIVTLCIRLLRPVTFTQAMSITSPDALILALQSPHPPTVLLALTVLQKASRTPAETVSLTTHSTLITTLLTTWLSNPSVEVGQSATRALTSLFETDCPVQSNGVLNLEMNGHKTTLTPSRGQGAFWSTIFDSGVNYMTIINLCGKDSPLTEHQRSLAQARLLRLLPILASLDFQRLTRARSSRMTTNGGIAHPAEQGLLYFAILGMVDRSDVLMHITLLDFIREILETVATVRLGRGEEEFLKLLMEDAVEMDEGVGELLTQLRGHVQEGEELAGLLERLNLRT